MNIRTFARPRAIILSALATLGIGSVTGIWQLQGGAAAQQAPPSVQVARGDLIVTVGAVGQIVEIGQSPQAPAPVSGAGTSPNPSPDVSAFSVFPQASGQVTSVLVVPGQHVTADEPVALLNDGGVQAAAIAQAQTDVGIARLELHQRLTNDPLKGIPPTKAEFAAGDAAVAAARSRLGRLLAPPRPADVSAARLDLARARADLETALGGPPEVRADSIRLARDAVAAAQARVERLLAPPNPADVAGAQADVSKAEADLEALTRSDRTQPVTQKEIDAAKAGIVAARAKLARVLAPPDAADVAAARLELERAQADLRRLLAGPSPAALAAARAAVVAAKARLRQLLSPPLESDVRTAKLDVRRALSDLAVLRARRGPASPSDIGLARLKVTSAHERLDAALHAAGSLTVRAPRAGTVTAVFSPVGTHVDPPMPVVALADLGRLEARVDLSEFDIAKVRAGQSATVGVDALGGKSLRGRVRFAALAGSSASGVVTFPVEVSLSDTAGLKPGMNVSVRIVVARHRDVVEVPLEAVSRETGRATVFVLDRGGKQLVRAVRLGLSNNKSVEIVKGLRARERVVLGGAAPGGGR